MDDMDREPKKQGNGMKAFKQQELKAWQPVLTPVAVIAMLLVVFVVFLPIGIVLEDCSNRVIEQSIRYDTTDACDEVTAKLQRNALPKKCAVSFELEHDFEPPIYFYYELKNFYQNHRRFAKSKSDTQLRGADNSDTSTCEPIQSYEGKHIVNCGLFPGSFFEDRFSMDYELPTGGGTQQLCAHDTPSDPCYAYATGTQTDEWNAAWSGFETEGSWQKEGIAWKTDVESKFAFSALDLTSQTNVGPRQNQSGLNLPRADDEDFIVWMRAAALPNFRKLHRVIKDVSLPKGTKVTVNIASWFPTKDFDGEKWITLGKTEWCGGANHALAWTYIVVACVAIGLTVTFAILLLFGSRKMADVNRFEWHNLPKNQALVSLS